MFQKKILVGLSVITAVCGMSPTLAAKPDFEVLKADQAKQFRLPNDVKFVKSIKAPKSVINRYQQYVGRAEVLGGQVSIVKSRIGGIKAVVGSHFTDLSARNRVVLSEARARQILQRERGVEGAFKAKLMIDPKSERYFYWVENPRFDSRWVYWIDAADGTVLKRYNALAHGSGDSSEGANPVNLLTTKVGNQYELRSNSPEISTYVEGSRRNRLPGDIGVSADDYWTDVPLVDAHYYSTITHAFFSSIGFSWIDHYNQGMVSTVHYGKSYANAFWNGEQMVYGDGDGRSFTHLSGDLDVVAHELSHGVTEAGPDLVYLNESGALNEAFSDIVASVVESEHYGFDYAGRWIIGEDVTLNGMGIRNMADPAIHGDPAHYDDRYTGTADNGGVHINSGIVNHWFYKLVTSLDSAAGTFATENANLIVWEGFSALSSTADFCDARAATVAVAGTYADAVDLAWGDVGLDDSSCSDTVDPVDPGPTDPGTGDSTAPVISQVKSSAMKGRDFKITWTTDEASDSLVEFNCCGPFDDAAMVTNHQMTFTGSKGASYTYYVTSKDASGNSSRVGPFTHNN